MLKRGKLDSDSSALDTMIKADRLQAMNISWTSPPVWELKLILGHLVGLSRQERINLSHNRLGSGVDLVQTLCACLRENTSLVEVDLGFNQLQPHHVFLFVEEVCTLLFPICFGGDGVGRTFEMKCPHRAIPQRQRQRHSPMHPHTFGLFASLGPRCCASIRVCDALS